MAYGDLVNCEIKPQGDSDVFRFSGQAGDKIVILAMGYSGAAAPCFRLEVQPGMPLGNYVCPGRVGFPSHFLGSVSSEFSLSTTGVYTIEVISEVTMQYGVYLYRSYPLPANSIPLQFGGVVSGEINPRGDTDFYTFTGTWNSRRQNIGKDFQVERERRAMCLVA